MERRSLVGQKRLPYEVVEMLVGGLTDTVSASVFIENSFSLESLGSR